MSFFSGELAAGGEGRRSLNLAGEGERKLRRRKEAEREGEGGVWCVRLVGDEFGGEESKSLLTRVGFGTPVGRRSAAGRSVRGSGGPRVVATEGAGNGSSKGAVEIRRGSRDETGTDSEMVADLNLGSWERRIGFAAGSGGAPAVGRRIAAVSANGAARSKVKRQPCASCCEDTE
jgi:hypothetical protein